jgi:flagellar basal body-associated protein FliL
MTELHEAAATGPRKSRNGVRFRSWKIIGLLLVALAGLGGGAGYWYWTARQPPTHATGHIVEPTFYLDLKPLVVSVADSSGIPHFVQLGLSLALSGKEAGNAVNRVLPEVQETMRETVLAFRVEDIVKRAGVDRLRQAIIAALNQLLLHRLGAAETNRLAAGAPNGTIVQNVFFQTLIVE